MPIMYDRILGVIREKFSSKDDSSSNRLTASGGTGFFSRLNGSWTKTVDTHVINDVSYPVYSVHVEKEGMMSETYYLQCVYCTEDQQTLWIILDYYLEDAIGYLDFMDKEEALCHSNQTSLTPARISFCAGANCGFEPEDIPPTFSFGNDDSVSSSEQGGSGESGEAQGGITVTGNPAVNGNYQPFDNSGYGNTPTYYCSAKSLYISKMEDDDNNKYWVFASNIPRSIADVFYGGNYSEWIYSSSNDVPTGTWHNGATISY